MPDSGKIAVSAVMLAIFTAMVAMAAGYPPQSRFLPWVIGFPAIALCIAQLVIDIAAMRRNGASADDGLATAAQLRHAAILFGWLVGFMTVILLFGFLAATPVLLFTFLRWHQRESLRISAGLAGGGAVGMWLIFDRLLELPLHSGFAIDWLFG